MAPADLGTASDGSQVILRVHERGDGKRSGVVLRVVPPPASPPQVHEGEVMRDVNGHYWLITPGGGNPFALDAGGAIFLPQDHLAGALAGDLVRVEAHPAPDDPKALLGRVTLITRRSDSFVFQVPPHPPRPPSPG